MKKYSDDPIVNFIHNEREARYQRLLEAVYGPSKKPRVKAKSIRHSSGKSSSK